MAPKVEARSLAAQELEGFLVSALRDFPWRLEVEDWQGARYAIGKGEPHWHGDALKLHVKTEHAGRCIRALRGLDALDMMVDGEIELAGNLYLLTWIRNYTNLELGPIETVRQILRHYAFQSPDRARISVKSHYDLPDEFFSYLDRAYRAYSCGIFENPDDLNAADMIRVGKGKGDDFDSLEAAQYRKFADAADYAAPKPGESVLDIGCGYGGQLIVGAERFPQARWSGWTHSSNQVKDGNARLRAAGVDAKTEIREGDYRQDTAVYDHALSTGMVCHVGPRGLVPYVRKVRSLVRDGGRYMHHVIMVPPSRRLLDSYIGVAFNKKYIWPGVHFFTVGEHIRALERNGFRVMGERNLTKHYAKTCAAWYERMMTEEKRMRAEVGDQTFRAFQIYLTGSSAGFHANFIEIHRIYCEAR